MEKPLRKKKVIKYFYIHTHICARLHLQKVKGYTFAGMSKKTNGGFLSGLLLKCICETDIVKIQVQK